MGIGASKSPLLALEGIKTEGFISQWCDCSNKKLLGAPGIATGSRDATNGAPGLTRNKNATRSKGIATRRDWRRSSERSSSTRFGHPEVPGSQLLFWTGAWEPLLPRGTLWKLREELRKNGFDQRGGFDCRVLDPRRAAGVGRLSSSG